MKSTEQKNKVGFLWFAIIAFALMAAAWLTLFTIAAKHKVKEVPLEHTRDSAYQRTEKRDRKVAQTFLSVQAWECSNSGTDKSGRATFPNASSAPFLQWISHA